MIIPKLKTLTLFYDATCPLCQAEILFLSGRNAAGLLKFIDIHSSQYQPTEVGVSCEQALASMYGQYDDGSLIQGVAVFSEAYARADLPMMAKIFSWKPAQPLLGIAYAFFAKNRHTISKIFGPIALRWVKYSSSSKK